MVALFDAAVFAVAPLVPAATARNFDDPPPRRTAR